jgi:hypothetical protein
MQQIVNINNDKCSIYITIKTNRPCQFRVIAEDLKPNSKYADRTVNVDTERTIFLSFPVSPKKISLSVLCMDNLAQSDYTITAEVKPLKHYEIWQDRDTKSFLELAVPFSQICGFQLPAKNGTYYQSEDKIFVIKYVPNIIDFKTSKVLNTPARVGHTTGKIEISASSYMNYTIPMRMMILLHEFSHKWKNPKMNLPISDEIGADINALYIYLGLGFSKVDAIYVYANVFLNAQTEPNRKRMRKIMDYIAKFESQHKAIAE